MSFKPTSSVVVRDYSGNSIVITSGTGLQIAQVGSTLKTGAFVIATSGSGGVALTTSGGELPFGLTLNNVSNYVATTSGSRIYVGSSGNPPYVSGGYLLGPGNEIKLSVNNPDCIRVYGSQSGATVSWIGVTN